MLVMTAELVDVRESEMDGKKTFNLVFRGSRYDVGLKCEVPASVQVMIADEHKVQVPEFKKMIGQQIEVQVDARVSKRNQVWYLTSGKGLIV